MSEVLGALATSSGDNSFLIPYEALYEGMSGGLKPLYFILVVIWIVGLFYCMYSIADRHFTWALEHLSNALRLSPDLAGLTLLAFGNGAPDFFTAVFGASGEPEMILGGSVGSGLFIVTVVFGLTLLMARKPGKDRIVVEEDGTIRPAEQTIVAESKSGLFNCVNVRHHMDMIPFIRSAGMYLFCIGFLFLFAVLRKIPLWLPALLLGIYAIYLGTCIAIYFGLQRRGERRLSQAASDVMESKSKGDERVAALIAFQQLGFWKQFSHALRVTCWREGWALESGIQKAFRLTLVILRAPVDLVLNLTILPIEVPEQAIEADNFVALRFLHRLRCIVNPFFSIFWYIFLLGPELGNVPWYVWPCYGAGSCIASILLLFSTSWTEPPRFFPLHVLYSFCTSILWIYATSSELLACLSVTGSQLGVSHTVMGILVLAWGNSFGDLVTDVAIAKNGSFETAVTAIFSGPVQNVLLTIGTGFLIAAIRSPTHAISLSVLPADMYLALAVLTAVVLLCLIIIPFKFDFMVPRTFGIGLLTIYVLYLPCALIFGLGIIKLPFL